MQQRSAERCHDNALIMSTFCLLKREQIQPHIHRTKTAARAAVLDHNEMRYDRYRR
jgi:hypothetical protein